MKKRRIMTAVLAGVMAVLLLLPMVLGALEVLL